jgi:hypothetical protein
MPGVPDGAGVLGDPLLMRTSRCRWCGRRCISSLCADCEEGPSRLLLVRSENPTWRIGITKLGRGVFDLGRAGVLREDGRIEWCYRDQWKDYIAADEAAFEGARS